MLKLPKYLVIYLFFFAIIFQGTLECNRVGLLLSMLMELYACVIWVQYVMWVYIAIWGVPYVIYVHYVVKMHYAIYVR